MDAVKTWVISVPRQIAIVIVFAGVVILVIMLFQIARRQLAVQNMPTRIRFTRGVLLRRVLLPAMGAQHVCVRLGDLVERSASRDSDHNPHSDTKRSESVCKPRRASSPNPVLVHDVLLLRLMSSTTADPNRCV
jgi:hypothetical protein